MRFDPKIVRETSFTLAPKGWDPDSVDAYLEELCRRVENGSPVDDLAMSNEFPN